MTNVTVSSRSHFFSRKLWPGIPVATYILGVIMLLSVILHFANLASIGDANTYYTAAVKSMLQSWHNFFFVAAEPGGSVTVDKPPLGLWVEAAFAFVLGVKGWVVSLPNILAGILSVPLLYHLVKKYMGDIAGLVAALVLVVTPVAIATDRNNTMDGMLVFTLLLAAWAFIKATESGKARWLFLGAFIMGLGFNIKMLQAFLPLPAFYALYFFGAKTGWGRKILYMFLSGILLLVVSLSWTIAVDMTPADQRPYIGSSEDNTVMELIVGHNGLSRLFTPQRNANKTAQAQNTQTGQVPGAAPGNQDQPALQTAPPLALAACSDLQPGAACSFQQPNGITVNGTCILPPETQQLACAPQNVRQQPPQGALGDGPNASPDGPNAGTTSTPFSQETGSPGILRFFVSPLSKQMSWLLPFAIISMVLMVFATRLRLPLMAEHKALLLWGGWLLTCLVFFSAVEGIFHAYYAIMLAPALGAVVGMGITRFWRAQSSHTWVNGLLVVSAGLTIAFQIFTAGQYGYSSLLIYLPLALWGVSSILLFPKTLRRLVHVGVLVAIIFIPLLWTGMTVLDKAPNTNLPTAIDAAEVRQIQSKPAAQLNEPNQANQRLVSYLQENTQDVEYLVAVANAHTGSPLVLATGRPVLYMGGFSGSDPVIDSAGLAEMVSNGELRYVLYDASLNSDISVWLKNSCSIVPQFTQGGNAPNQQQLPGNQVNASQGNATFLYFCH